MGADRNVRWKRAVATPLLLGWFALLALAAWPNEVRPHVFDRVHDVSAAGLRLLGFSAGQPLFETDASPWKQHGYCFYVRARPAPEDGSLLFPPGGRCRILGFHWTLAPVDQALHRMLSTAWELFAAGRVEESAPFPRAIGRAFCRQADAPFEGIDAAWVWYYKHYDDGSVLRRNGAFFAYSCADEALTQLDWDPDDASLRASWGSAPW